MSNIGKIKVVLPTNLDVSPRGWLVYVKGPNGEKIIRLPQYTRVEKTHGLLWFKPHGLHASAYGSLQRKLRAFIYGIAYHYVKRLLFVGVGYRARQENQQIILRLGYSHEICLNIPNKIHLRIVKRNNVILNGYNLDEISQFAYKLRSFREPEPYKGKGIVLLGENIRRKEGKKKKL